MKRLAAFISALALALSLCACGSPGCQEGKQLPVSGMTDRLPRITVSL